MLLGLLILSMNSWAFTPQDRLPRPTDSELRAKVVAERTEGRIVSLEFEETARGGGRVGCGLIAIDGVTEPVAVNAAWKEQLQQKVTVVGAPPLPVEEPYWDVRVIGATRVDRDQDGEFTRYDRNSDTLGRSLALSVCPGLAPPPGVIWTTELEPHPDPVRAERARRLARSATERIFGAPSEPAPPNR